MSKKNSYLLGILLTIGIGTILHYFLCCNCDCEKDKTPQPNLVNNETALPQSVFSLQGNGIDYRCNGNFDFLNNDFKSIIPINDSVNLGINNLKKALETSKQRLSVMGYALASEKNTSAFENLGLARANDVKNYFVSRGIPSNSIDIKGEIKDDLLQKENTVYGPVSFTLNDVTETTKVDWNAVKSEINAAPLILYFNSGQASIDLSDSDRKKITELTRYLDNVDGAKLDVVGYTDNVGDRTKNIELGKGRADFAKEYLVTNGVSAEKIISSSKGPDQPIASNTSTEGKAKNRRTEVKIN